MAGAAFLAALGRPLRARAPASRRNGWSPPKRTPINSRMSASAASRPSGRADSPPPGCPGPSARPLSAPPGRASDINFACAARFILRAMGGQTVRECACAGVRRCCRRRAGAGGAGGAHLKVDARADDLHVSRREGPVRGRTQASESRHGDQRPSTEWPAAIQYPQGALRPTDH